ncbi:MAG: hypothetical protein ACU84Q_01145 [Gammaproteobacteria bacterium]
MRKSCQFFLRSKYISIDSSSESVEIVERHFIAAKEQTMATYVREVYVEHNEDSFDIVFVDLVAHGVNASRL